MSNNVFSEVSKFKLGYDMSSVDEFFKKARQAYESETLSLGVADIQNASFPLIRGSGYATEEVDAALDRLEVAFTVKYRDDIKNTLGANAWSEELTARARTLYGRLRRPAGERFDTPRDSKWGYDKKEVDALCDRLTAYFDRSAIITSSDVKFASFSARKNSKAYDEASVDAFLARATQVLLGVE